MKYSIDTYRLYQNEKRFSNVIRARVSMKDPVDIEISSGKDARHGTFVRNYSGQMNWGEVADYVGSYSTIVEGHLVFEVTSLGDKIFLSFMRLFQETRYVTALEEVLDELGIPCKVEGPFPKHLSRHVLP